MKIPFAEVQTESPGQLAAPPQIDQAHLPGMAAAGAGAMTEKIGEGIQRGAQVADKILEAREKVQISNATVDVAGQLQDARLELEKDPDTAGRLAKFQAKAEQIKQQQLSQFSGAGASDFTIRFNQLYKPMELDVKQGAWREEIQQHKLDLGSSLDKLASQAVFAKTPLERESIQAEADKQIQQAVNSGYLRASDATHMKHAYLGNVDKALAAELVRLNPEAAISALGDPNKFPYLSAADRVTERTRAQARLESLSAQDRAEARVDAAEITQAINNAIANGEPMPPEDEVRSTIARLRGTPSGLRLERAWNVGNAALAAAAGKSVPELEAERARVFNPPATAGVSPSLAGVQASVGDALKAQGIDLTGRITSATRTPQHDRDVGGSGGGEHTRGNALDISLAGLTEQQQKEVVDRFLSDPRVKGFGYYPDHIHIDTRAGAAVAWGIKNAPQWVNDRVSGWTGNNLAAADQALKLTPQEKYLWHHHADNLSQGGVRQRDGGISTILAITTEIDGKAYILPTIWDNKPLEPDQAIERAKAEGLDKFPSYATEAEAKARYDEMHKFLDKESVPTRPPTTEELRVGHALTRIIAHQKAERDRDPRLHARVDQMEKALDLAMSSKDSPRPSEQDFNKLMEDVGGADTPMGQRLMTKWRMTNAVGADKGKSIDEQQARVDELRKPGASASELVQAAHLEAILRHNEEMRRTDPAIRHDLEQFVQLANKNAIAGLPLPSQESYEQLLDRVGGPASASGTVLMRAWSDANAIAHDVQGKSIAELTATANRLLQTNASPEDLAHGAALSHALQIKREALAADSAAYVQRNYPTIAEGLAQAEQKAASNDVVQQAQGNQMRRDNQAAMIDAQRREGVPEEKIALMTKPQAEAVYGKITTAAPQERADLVTSLRESYGDYWPIVQRQLSVNHALPPDVAILAQLPTGEDANLLKTRVVQAYSLKPTEATELLGSQTVKDITDSVRRASADMVTSMNQAADGPRTIATWQSGIQKLAELYMIRGETSVNKAVKRAADELFYNNWTLSSAVNGVSVRIPNEKGQPIVAPADVTSAQRLIVSQLPNLELAIPDVPGVSETQRKIALINNIKSFGFWVSTADEKGMALMAGNGQPVMLESAGDPRGGTPLIVPFDSVRALADQRAATSGEIARLVERAPFGLEGAFQERFEDPAAVSLPGALITRYGNQPPPGSTVPMPLPQGTPTPGPVGSQFGRPTVGGQTPMTPTERLRSLGRRPGGGP